jgi:outer membrane protein OmpA-like peptidoglycan-associated protein
VSIKTCLHFGTIAFTLVIASTAAAQIPIAPGFALDRYQPSERGSDWFVTDSLDLRGNGRLAIGVVQDWAHKPLAIYDANGHYKVAPVQNQLFFHVGAAVNFASRVRLAFSLPLLASNFGTPGIVDGVIYRTREKTAIGDLRLGLDLRLFGEYGSAFTTAIGVQVHVPTGNRDSHASDGKARLVPHWLMAGDIGAFTYAAVLGFDGRFQTDNVAGTAFGPELNLAASAGIRVADKKVVIGPEFWTSTVVSDSGDGFFKAKTTPIQLILGAHARLGPVQLGAGVGPGLTRAMGTPDVRVLSSLAYFPEPPKPPPPPLPKTDRDDDGIADGVDACPDTPGEKNDDPEKNGCPPPKDRDNDKIIDDDDACPDEAGVPTDDPKTNGCPKPKDRDDDGIIDDNDACPDEYGEKTEDPKTNGCPKPKDTDGDGITDDKDACVHDAGPSNEDPKKNGCPKVVVVAGEVKIMERIEFDTGKATIRPESDGILKAVAEILTKHSEIKKIQIQGHTDNKGAKAMNKTLSEKRAASVKSWLIKAGIDGARLESKGFGQEEPIDTNDSDAGRQNNRRVQFIILEKDKGKTKIDTE